MRTTFCFRRPYYPLNLLRQRTAALQQLSVSDASWGLLGEPLNVHPCWAATKFHGRKPANIKHLEIKIIIKEKHLSLLGIDLASDWSVREENFRPKGRQEYSPLFFSLMGEKLLLVQSAALIHLFIAHAPCSASKNCHHLPCLHCSSVSPPYSTHCQQHSWTGEDVLEFEA